MPCDRNLEPRNFSRSWCYFCTVHWMCPCRIHSTKSWCKLSPREMWLKRMMQYRIV